VIASIKNEKKLRRWSVEEKDALDCQRQQIKKEVAGEDEKNITKQAH